MTVNGENKEPIPFPETGVGAAGATQEQAQTTPASPSDVLFNQALLVQDLGMRVAHLIDATKDAFVRFLVESEAFYQMVRAIREVETGAQGDNSTANSTPEKASS